MYLDLLVFSGGIILAGVYGYQVGRNRGYRQAVLDLAFNDDDPDDPEDNPVPEHKPELRVVSNKRAA